MGAKLGTVWARAGHDVVFSYSRDPAKLQRLAQDAAPRARAATPRQAAADAEVLLLAVHWSRLDDLLEQAGNLAGKTLITCMLPLNQDNSQLVIAHTSSGAEALAEKVPNAPVISAFGTIPSEVIFGVFDARHRTIPRPDMLYCGDDRQAKNIAATLIRDAGFNPADAGALHMARYLEPFSMAFAQIVYESDRGPELAYRFERFTRAG